MTSTTHHETQIVSDPDVPLVRIVREFDAPPEKVFRAHTDPDLVVVAAQDGAVRVGAVEGREDGGPVDPNADDLRGGAVVLDPDAGMSELGDPHAHQPNG